MTTVLAAHPPPGASAAQLENRVRGFSPLSWPRIGVDLPISPECTGENAFVYGDSQRADLFYLRARYYDPATAQFLSRDPLVAMTMSPYGYVAGNPLNGADPSGLDGQTPAPQPSWEGPGTPGRPGTYVAGKWCGYDGNGNIPAGAGIITGENKIKKWLRDRGNDFTDDDFHRAVGRLKGQVEGNRDVGMDPQTGEAYAQNPDGSFGSELGNIEDEINGQSGKSYSVSTPGISGWLLVPLLILAIAAAPDTGGASLGGLALAGA